MVTYLSGERIQGSSAGVASADAEDDFSGSDNWLDTSDDKVSVNTSTDVLDFNIQRNSSWACATLDLQNGTYGIGSNASDTAWVLRWKMSFTTHSPQNGGALMWIGLTEHPSSTNIDQSGDSIVLRWFNKSDPWYQLDGGTSNMNNQYGTHATLATYATSTTYYNEIARTGDSVTATTWSGSYGGTVMNTQTRSYSGASPADLRYIRVSNYGNDTDGSAGLIGTIDDVEFWNNTSNRLKDEKVAITNVPTGTRYEETDTRKIFRYGTSPNALGWAEKGVEGTDAYAWYDATDASTISKDGSDLVSAWADKNGTTARNLAQSTSGDKPTWKNNEHNSRDAIDFTGGSLMRVDFGADISQPYTFASVCYFPANDNSERILFDGGETGATPGSKRAYFGIMDTDDTWRVNASSNLGWTTSSVAGTWGYVIVKFNGSSTNVRINGTSVVTGNAGSNVFRGLTCGQFIDGSSAQSWNEPIMHLIIYDKELTAAEIVTLETWLAGEAGL